MMKVQNKTLEGAKPAEKKEMIQELSRMIEKMNARMSEMKGQGMMMQDMMGGAASAESKKEEQPCCPQKAQEKTEGGVTVKVALESADGTTTFKVILETHAVNLDGYKVDEIVVLRADGKEYKAQVKSQEGSGHHRAAVVAFDNPKAKEVEIVIKDVAGVKERVFKF